MRGGSQHHQTTFSDMPLCCHSSLLFISFFNTAQVSELHYDPFLFNFFIFQSTISHRFHSFFYSLLLFPLHEFQILCLSAVQISEFPSLDEHLSVHWENSTNKWESSVLGFPPLAQASEERGHLLLPSSLSDQSISLLHVNLPPRGTLSTSETALNLWGPVFNLITCLLCSHHLSSFLASAFLLWNVSPHHIDLKDNLCVLHNHGFCTMLYLNSFSSCSFLAFRCSLIDLIK